MINLLHKRVNDLRKCWDARSAHVGGVDGRLVAHHALDHRVRLEHLVQRVRDLVPTHARCAVKSYMQTCLSPRPKQELHNGRWQLGLSLLMVWAACIRSDSHLLSCKAETLQSDCKLKLSGLRSSPLMSVHEANSLSCSQLLVFVHLAVLSIRICRRWMAAAFTFSHDGHNGMGHCLTLRTFRCLTNQAYPTLQYSAFRFAGAGWLQLLQ